jgi:hypothetical protein
MRKLHWLGIPAATPDVFGQKHSCDLSNIVDVPRSTTPFSIRRDFLFIGGFQHPPNIDAVLYFTDAIYPLVKERLNDAKFYIIGEKPPPEVIALATEKIIVTGLQTDGRPFLRGLNYP